MEVTFPAQIKQLQSRILASGDKAGKMVLEFNLYDNELIGKLDRFVKTDAESEIIIREIKRQ